MRLLHFATPSVAGDPRDVSPGGRSIRSFWHLGCVNGTTVSHLRIRDVHAFAQPNTAKVIDLHLMVRVGSLDGC